MPATPRAKARIVYHRDGSVWAKGQMRGKNMAGYWEWFRKDGTIMRSGSFVNGQQTGEWTTYDRKGKVYKVTKMKAIAVRAKRIAKPVTSSNGPTTHSAG